ncbi:MAG: hypothetical protein WHV66_07650 [Anaerolineales bacterium]|jgi:electron transfer flavoprotein beta subunit
MSLNIVVCLKQVLDTQLPLQVDESGPRMVQDVTQPVYIINPADLSALEAAMHLKVRLGARLTALTLGTERAVDVLRHALARGADAALHLVSEKEELDVWTIAEQLSSTIAGLKAELILCGDSSLDGASGLVGAFIAEQLHLPLVTRAIQLELLAEQRKLRTWRQMERGARAIVECPLPALVCTSALIAQPQYVSVHRLQHTDNSRIERIAVSSVKNPALPGCTMGGISAPRLRPRKMPAPQASLSAAQRIRFLMGGAQPAAKPESKLVEGSTQEAVERVVKFLQERGLL